MLKKMPGIEKIKIKLKKKRIPLPKKPPKIQPAKNAYFRDKEKDKLRKNRQEE